MALGFVADLMTPLVDKIDTVHYTKRSRLIKVAEEYAVRLLQTNYPPDQAEKIAQRLVNHYPEHGFVIDEREAREFLNIGEPTAEQRTAIDRMEEALTMNRETTIIGELQVVETQTT